MTKAELEERELKLEAIVQGMYEVYEKVCTLKGGMIGSLINHDGDFDGLMRGLYNAAEIRTDINELVAIGISFKEESDE